MEKDLLSGNEVLARFDGFLYGAKVDIDDSECGGIYTRTTVYSKTPILIDPYPESDQYYLKEEWNPEIGTVKYGELKYDTDWNELMPVWYKFRELKCEDRQSISIHHTYCMDIERKICRECKDSPEPAFNELVKAVTWYNTIKKVYINKEDAVVKNNLLKTWKT